MEFGFGLEHEGNGEVVLVVQLKLNSLLHFVPSLRADVHRKPALSLAVVNQLALLPLILVGIVSHFHAPLLWEPLSEMSCTSHVFCLIFKLY